MLVCNRKRGSRTVKYIQGYKMCVAPSGGLLFSRKTHGHSLEAHFFVSFRMAQLPIPPRAPASPGPPAPQVQQVQQPQMAQQNQPRAANLEVNICCLLGLFVYI